MAASRRPGSVPARAASAPNATRPVRFSGDWRVKLARQSTNKLLPAFQNISEVFFWAYLAQDALSMVLPRIVKGTIRGSEHYEPSQDPQARNLPFKEQMKLYFVENFKRLNWTQGTEEIKREITAGPGLLAVPALMFLLIGKLLGHKSALELSKPALDGLSGGFIDRLAQAEEALKAGKTDFPSVLRGHLEDLFIDPDFKKFQGTYLKDWAAQWADAVERHAGNPHERNRVLSKLADEFAETVWDFNSRHHMQDYQIQLPGEAAPKTITHNLHRRDQVWVQMGKQAKQQPVKPLMEDLIRWSDYVDNVKKQAARADEPLANAARKLLRRMTKHKFLMGAGMTLAGGLYLIRITKWVMSNETYAANRLLQLPQGAQSTGAALPAGGVVR